MCNLCENNRSQNSTCAHYFPDKGKKEKCNKQYVGLYGINWDFNIFESDRDEMYLIEVFSCIT